MYIGPGQTLEVKLAGAVATNELPVTASYFEADTTTMDAAAWGFPTTQTNGAVAVTVVADPGAGKVRQLKLLTVRNRDTAPATITIQVNHGGTVREQWRCALAIGDSFSFTDTDGPRVVDFAGALTTSVLSVLAPHAVTHKHLGGDEVAVAAPAANAIPKAGAGGALASAWIETPFVPGLDNTGEIGTDLLRWQRVRAAVVSTGDLELKRETPRGMAHWVIEEEIDELIVTNKTNGKRFRFLLQEI